MAPNVSMEEKRAFPKVRPPGSVPVPKHLKDTDDPTQLGFIQAGYVYYAEGRTDLPHIYVESVVGDGGLRFQQNRGHYLTINTLGPDPDRKRDRKGTSTRGSLLRWVTHRIRHQDLEYPLHETPTARAERVEEEARARTGANISYIPQRPN